MTESAESGVAHAVQPPPELNPRRARAHRPGPGAGPARAGAFNFRITVPGKAAHGALRAGVWASTVERLTFEGRLGFAPDEDPGVARWELETAL